MTLPPDASYIAFEGDHCVASGDLREVARAAKQTLDRRKDASILVFDAGARTIEIDFRGSIDDVLARLPAAAGAPATPESASAPRGPGRPKLGVVAREVTLLPRHWDWLAGQPGGASVAIRRLVERARHSSEDKDRTRAAQEAAYRFMSTMAGDRPRFEEAARALFANEPARFEKLIAGWPADVRTHVTRLAGGAFHREADVQAG
jgi:hypothetical protein